MYNKIALSCILTFTLVNTIFTQNIYKNGNSQKDEFNEKFNIIKFEPIQLLDPLNTFHLSFEKQTGKHTSFQFGLGYIFDSYSISSNKPKLEKGGANFKIKTDFRIYCKDFQKGKTSWFFAPQLFFKQAIFNCESYYSMTPTAPNYLNYYVDKYKITHQEVGIYGKTGFQSISKKDFVFEIYFGPGLKYVFSKTYGEYFNHNNNSNSNIYNTEIIDLGYDYTQKQNGISVCFTIGVSFGKCFSNFSEK